MAHPHGAQSSSRLSLASNGISPQLHTFPRRSVCSLNRFRWKWTTTTCEWMIFSMTVRRLLGRFFWKRCNSAPLISVDQRCQWLVCLRLHFLKKKHFRDSSWCSYSWQFCLFPFIQSFNPVPNIVARHSSWVRSHASMRRIHVQGAAANWQLCLVSVTCGIEVTAHARCNVELA